MTIQSSNKGSATINRFMRLVEVQTAEYDGLTVKEIAAKLKISEQSVLQTKRYLKELLEFGLTPDTVNQKRSELYIEYCEACSEAKKLFEKYRDNDESKASDIKRFLTSWVEIIDKKAKLFGFDSVKIGELNLNAQFNKQDNYIDVVDAGVGDQIAELIKKSHEAKLLKKYKEENE